MSQYSHILYRECSKNISVLLNSLFNFTAMLRVGTVNACQAIQEVSVRGQRVTMIRVNTGVHACSCQLRLCMYVCVLMEDMVLTVVKVSDTDIFN